jgi:hypothetical protein
MSTNPNEVELLQEELDWWKSQLKEAAKLGDLKYAFEAKNSIFDVESHLENIHKIAAAGRDGWDSILLDS